MCCYTNSVFPSKCEVDRICYKVVEIKELGSHDMFMAEIVAVHGDEKYYDPSTGLFQLNQADLITYSHGKYYALGEKIGKFGFSVERIQHRRKR